MLKELYNFIREKNECIEVYLICQHTEKINFSWIKYLNVKGKSYEHVGKTWRKMCL